MNALRPTLSAISLVALYAGSFSSLAQAQDPADDVFIEEGAPEQQQAYPPANQAPQQPAGYAQPQQAPQPVYAQPANAQPAPAYPLPQEQPLELRRPNTVYVEGFGGGLWWSLNYERLVLEDLAIRAGFGYVGLEGIDSDGSSVSVGFISIPLSVSYLGLGSTRHMFEVGAGAMIIGFTGTVRSGLSTSSGSGAGAFGQVFGGYRYHPSGRAGFNFRAGVLAIIGRGLSLSSSDPNAVGALPWPYISAGASF